jgi:uncharacterized protein (TIGR02118 family)
MTVTLFIAYPKGAELNLDYYTNKHIPLALKAWEKLPFTGWKLETPVGDKSPYEIVFTVSFDSMEGVGKMQTDVTPAAQKELQADLVNYSKKPPQIWVMDVKKSSL